MNERVWLYFMLKPDFMLNMACNAKCLSLISTSGFWAFDSKILNAGLLP